MSDEKDFDYGICKIPRKDKDGNDISGDRIGKGGRHRNDGTFSGMVYDVQEVEHDPSLVETKTVYIEQEVPFWKVLISDLVRDCAPILLDKGEIAIRNWWIGRKEKKDAERTVKSKVERRAYRKGKSSSRLKIDQIMQEAQEKEATTVLEKKSTMIVMPDEFDLAYEQYMANMTSEEAQKELLEAFVLYVLALRKFNKISNAHIVDSAGNITDGRTVIIKLSAPDVVANINAILENNLSLLESWQSVALADILGRSLIEEKRFVPIDSITFQQGLLNKIDNG